MIILVLLGLCLFCTGCNGGGGSDPVLAWNFIKAVSTNYCLLGAPDWNQHFDMLKRYSINALRVFAYAGWGDNYCYQGWVGNDISQLNEGFLNGLKSFVKQANSKGIIVILSMFHKNGDPLAYAMTQSRDRVRAYCIGIAQKLKGMGVIFEAINEDVDQGFCNFVQSSVREVWPDAKTCFYRLGGANYFIDHVKNKNYIGGKKIHSNDVGGYAEYYNDNDYIRITQQAKDNGGHVEWLVYWGRGGQQFKTTQQIEAYYGNMLNGIKNIK